MKKRPSPSERAFERNPNPQTLLGVLEEKQVAGKLVGLTQKAILRLLNQAGFNQHLIGRDETPAIKVKELLQETSDDPQQALNRMLFLGEEETVLSTSKEVRIRLGKLLQHVLPFNISSDQEVVCAALIFPECSRVIITKDYSSMLDLLGGRPKFDFESLSTLSSLIELEIDPTVEIDNEDMHSLGKLKSLASLRIHEGGNRPRRKNEPKSKFDGNYNSIALHRVDDEGLAPIAQMPQLRSLHVIGLQHVTRKGAQHLQGLSELKSLNLSGSEVDDEALRVIGSFADLEELDLSGTPITDAGIEYLSKLKKLKRLVLDGTCITDGCLELIACFPQLMDLSISGKSSFYRKHDYQNTNITDSGIAQLISAKKLKSLNLRFLSGLTKDAMAHVAQIPHLTSLDISDIYTDALSSDGLAHLHHAPQLRKLVVSRFLGVDGEDLEDKERLTPLIQSLKASKPQLHVEAGWRGLRED